MIAVIGSGPAGISAARALVARGRRVLLLDGGLQLEPERRDLVDRLGRQSPDEWPAAAVRSIRDASEVRLGGVPEKLTYGSDFPYREARRSIAASSGQSWSSSWVTKTSE